MFDPFDDGVLDLAQPVATEPAPAEPEPVAAEAVDAEPEPVDAEPGAEG
jgi:hypothetical protein